MANEWILGNPTGTDNTNFEWVLGNPYINYEKTAAGGTNMKINIGDVWKDVVSIKINIGDVWKTIF